MSLAVSYPGVYVQAIVQPSPPDAGVATSLAAFVGRTALGPVDEPVLLNGWGDYQRVFGGLSADSSISYQVAAFFDNGGGQALVVRLFEPSADETVTAIGVEPLFAIGNATADIVQTLEAEAAAGAGLEQMQLVAGRRAGRYAGQPGVAAALTPLMDEIAKAPSPWVAPGSAAFALPSAYLAAVSSPALTASKAYGPTAAALKTAVQDMDGLRPHLAAVRTAQAALQATTGDLATMQSTVKAFAEANFPKDDGAASIVGAVDGIASGGTVKQARDAVVAELKTLIPDKVAGEAIDAYETQPAGDLMVAIARAKVNPTVETLRQSASLQLRAKSPGAWGNRLGVSVDRNGVSPLVATSLGVADPADLFNVTVTYVDPSGLTQTETFRNVSINPAYPTLSLASTLAARSRYVEAVPGAAVASDLVLLSGAGGLGAGGQDSLPLSLSTYLGNEAAGTGIYALDQAPLFNMLCIPPDVIDGDTPSLVYQVAAQYCTTRNAMLIVDPPTGWQAAYDEGNLAAVSLADLGSFGADEGRNSAVYFPRVLAADPLRNGQVRAFPNSGYVAGLWAQTDVQTGIWKAPAGLDAVLNGVAGLEASLSDVQNGMLNPLGINCLRTFPIAGTVVWGARTMRGADQLGDPYAYVPVRRMLLYLMDWTLQNTKWAVFRANDASLWSGLRLQISSLMNGLWKQGALFGTSADQAYFVKCDATTTLQADIDAGRVNIQIGFAPVKPAEFVVVTLQQIAGQA